MFSLETELKWKKYYMALGDAIHDLTPVPLEPSTEIFKPWFDEYQNRIRNGTLPYHVEFREYANKEIIKLEQTYLNDHNQLYDSTEMKTVNKYIWSLNAVATAHLLTGHPDDYHVLDSIKNMIGNMTYHTASGTIGGLTIPERLRQHLGSIFKSKKREDFVFFENYDNAIPILIKTADESQGEVYENQMLPHQYFVGMIMNGMKQDIPNYMYTYGIAYTPLPLLPSSSLPVENDNLVFIDNYSHSKRSMLFIESIKGISFDEYIMKISKNTDPVYQIPAIEQLKSLIMQVLYSLEIAQHQHRFVHGDLHINNVLVSPHYDIPHLITYRRPSGSDRYMAVTSVAMIIDYGDSYVEVDGVGYGTFRVEMGTFPRFNQFTDAFRFLSNVLHQLMSLPPSNYLNQVTALVKKIWNQFFSTDSIRSTFEELIENDTYFIIQTPPIDYPSFSDFIDKVERILDVKYHLPLRPTDALPLIPMSYHDVLSEEGIVHHQYPNNIVDGYYTIKSIDEAISHLNDNPTKRDKLTKTRNDFLAYLRGLPSYHDQLETLIKSIMTQIDNHTVISTMEMYPPLNIGDPRAYSYVINYIKLLIRTNIAATKLKYIALFDRDNYDRLTNLNLTNWNVIESNPPLEKLMKKLRLYHIRSQNVPNDHRLSPSSTELTTLEDQHTYSHQIPEWFDKNYYRLKDIIPAHLFR